MTAATRRGRGLELAARVQLVQLVRLGWRCSEGARGGPGRRRRRPSPIAGGRGAGGRAGDPDGGEERLRMAALSALGGSVDPVVEG